MTSNAKGLFFCVLIVAAAIAIASASACKVSRLDPVSFHTRYDPQGSSGAITTAPACVAFRTLNVSDGRADKRLAGVRSLQEKADRSDIFMEGDVELWLRAGVTRGLDHANFQEEDDASFDLNISLAALHIDEVAFRNSTYDGRVVLDVELVDVSSGESVWKERTDGTAKNYGRPGKRENYQETINHALDRAVANSVNNMELRDKLCGRS
jgi:hypothetical protein